MHIKNIWKIYQRLIKMSLNKRNLKEKQDSGSKGFNKATEYHNFFQNNNTNVNNQSHVSISIIGVSILVGGYFYLNSNFKGIEGMLSPLNQSSDKTIALLNKNNKSNEMIMTTLNQYNSKAIEVLDQINNNRVISSLKQNNKSFTKEIKRKPANKPEHCPELTPVNLYIKK